MKLTCVMRTLVVEDVNVNACRLVAGRTTHVMSAVGELASPDRQSTDERLRFDLRADFNPARHTRFERYVVAEPRDVTRWFPMAGGVARDLDRLEAIDKLVSAHRHRCKQTHRQVA